jgi:NRAMP (natural resistance-associated macrophage protein)-like metal ion transporter
MALETNPIRRFFAVLGPGLITGAADDDPSGIATYSIAGAQLGPALLWTALLTWPLMGCVQMMCARIGMVTGRGLAAALGQKFPRWLVVIAALALFGANTINVGADLAGMADAMQMLTGAPAPWFVVGFGVVITWATVRWKYGRIANVLKWLALALFAYVITGFIVKPDWGEVAHAVVFPALPHGSTGWGLLVAILGTTISPYLFFWQSSQEVEEEKALGLRLMRRTLGASPQDLGDRKLDVAVGAFFSNLVMFFIILTTAYALHRNGITEIQTCKDAAAALFPLAGRFAGALFTLGIVGVGLLAIPTLSGSAAYAFAEVFRWRSGLDRNFDSARAFYRVIMAATLVGVVIVFGGVNPVRALYWSAVINGLLAPFLLIGIVLLAADRKIMQSQPSPKLNLAIVSLTVLLMLGAAVGMFVF